VQTGVVYSEEGGEGWDGGAHVFLLVVVVAVATYPPIVFLLVGNTCMHGARFLFSFTSPFRFEAFFLHGEQGWRGKAGR